jgi:23S rRNA (adenine2030-N6)-methyltransferase
MNYRHGYHAGNFADILKHLALCELLRLLTAKDKKLFVLDSHAGAGGYDLGGRLARRTGEAEAGVARLAAAPRSHRPLRPEPLRHRWGRFSTSTVRHV